MGAGRVLYKVFCEITKIIPKPAPTNLWRSRSVGFAQSPFIPDTATGLTP